MRKFLLFNPISDWFGRIGLSITRAQIDALNLFEDGTASKTKQ